MKFFGKKVFAGHREKKTPFVIITGCAGSGKTSLGEKIARTLRWTYVDKDTVTRGFTDYILVEKGKSCGDRESDLYCRDIRPIEYRITFKVCEENLRLGNPVILTIPFIAQIRDYCKWIDMITEFGMDLTEVDIKFVWINHNEGGEFARITRRGAARDGYKLRHWEEYAKGIDGISPDERYCAYCYDNDSYTADEMYVKDVIAWITK